jgi:hypothetical protein
MFKFSPWQHIFIFRPKDSLVGDGLPQSLSNRAKPMQLVKRFVFDITGQG